MVHSPAPGTDPTAAESFAGDEFEGELAPVFRPRDLAAAIARLADPASALETVHWGRNYLYATTLDTATGELEVVVKQFRNQTWKARLRRRLSGSKAAKSWHAARALEALGVPTARPVLLAESTRADGPSLFVTERLQGVFEARYLFRALASGEAAARYPQIDLPLFFDELGRLLRRLHDGGVWHRDVSIGNILVDEELGADGRPQLRLIDLNRARLDTRLTVGRRTRDLCRLRIFEPEHQELLLRAYWGPEATAFAAKRLLYRVLFWSFQIRMELKKTVKAPFRWLWGRLTTRRPHGHIPPPPEAAGVRDRVAWDYLSDQPHQHAGRWERLSVRLADLGEHGRAATAVTRVAPAVWRRYRALERQLYRRPVAWGEIGVAVRPWPDDPEALLAAVEELGVRRIYLRLHLWQEDHVAEEALARELHRRGFDLAFGLAQNREVVVDPGRWRQAVEEVAARFLPFGTRFQVGQAVNRSKWGVWKYSEYLDLAATACEVLRQAGPAEMFGPAVIDFEFHAAAAILNLPAAGRDFDFDGVSSLLYVDRRGAPEGRQVGFDTADKVVLLRAVAETARHAGDRCWITEVNWPLREGPHAPAGHAVAIDEESQADYLVRYYLLALGTGLVERVDWWQLVARGYGVVDSAIDGTLRRRPAFWALATLERQLAGSSFLGPLAAPPPVRLYQFRTAEGDELVVGWSPEGATTATLPRPAVEAVSRDGEVEPGPPGPTVTVTPSPRYFKLTSS